jgi:hypothetical protein
MDWIPAAAGMSGFGSLVSQRCGGGSIAIPARLVSPMFHEPPRSLRNFFQYSSRLRISRSKPRSGGS